MQLKRLVMLIATVTLFTVFAVLYYGISSKVAKVAGAVQSLRPTVQNGVLDATTWNLETQAPLALDGKWAFTWHQLVGPHSSSSPSISHTYIEVPGTWQPDALVNPFMSNQGYGTYHLTILLNRHDVNRTLGLYLPNVATSYKLWVNRDLIAANGRVGTTPSTMIPKNYSKVVFFQPSQRRITLTMQVANFVQRKGGLWESLQIGRANAILRTRTITVIANAFVIACLSIMGLYHIVVFLARRQDKSSLYFGFLCLDIALSTGLLGQVLLVYLWPSLNWAITTKFEYWTAINLAPLTALFVRTQYPKETHRTVIRAVVLIAILFDCIVLVTPAILYTKFILLAEALDVLTFLYVIQAFMMAKVRKREGAVVHLLGVSIFFVSLINDVLFYDHIVHIGPLTSFGLLAMLCTECAYLAVRFARSFTQVESLSANLRELNESLESLVTERTLALTQANSALKDANENLHRLEQARSHLLRDISHEMGTPLTSVQGYIKGMLDGVVDRTDRYLTLVYDKSTLIQRVMRDLIVLSKLETSALSFDFQEMDYGRFLNEVFNKYALEMQQANLEYTLIWLFNLPPDSPLLVKADAVRIEQVLSNLVLNARKFTDAGGRVSVEVEYEKNTARTGTVKATVRNTGPGLSRADLSHVFDRFYQGSIRPRLNDPGSGLGLAIAKEIVQAHGGQITAFNPPEGGCAFQFSLPAILSSEVELVTR